MPSLRGFGVEAPFGVVGTGASGPGSNSHIDWEREARALYGGLLLQIGLEASQTQPREEPTERLSLEVAPDELGGSERQAKRITVFIGSRCHAQRTDENDSIDGPASCN